MKFKQALDATKVAKPSTKIAAVPVLFEVVAEIQEAAGTFLDKTKEKKALEAEITRLGGILADYVRIEQDKRAFNGQFSNSYKIQTPDGGFLTVTTKNVFKINPDDKDTIKKLLKNQYSNLIEEKLEVVLKPEVLENEKLQEELIAALGKDGFQKFFNTTTSLKVTENFDTQVYEYAATFRKPAEKLAEIRAVIEPSKSTLK